MSLNHVEVLILVETVLLSIHPTIPLHPILRYCYNSTAHCPLLQCLRTTSAILAGVYYLVVSSFKCEGKIVAMT